jgi:hypothetical protein
VFSTSPHNAHRAPACSFALAVLGWLFFLVSPQLPVHDQEAVADCSRWYVEFEHIFVSLHKFVEGRGWYPIPPNSEIGGGRPGTLPYCSSLNNFLCRLMNSP